MRPDDKASISAYSLFTPKNACLIKLKASNFRTSKPSTIAVIKVNTVIFIRFFLPTLKNFLINKKAIHNIEARRAALPRDTEIIIIKIIAPPIFKTVEIPKLSENAKYTRITEQIAHVTQTAFLWENRYESIISRLPPYDIII